MEFTLNTSCREVFTHHYSILMFPETLIGQVSLLIWTILFYIYILFHIWKKKGFNALNFWFQGINFVKAFFFYVRIAHVVEILFPDKIYKEQIEKQSIRGIVS